MEITDFKSIAMVEGAENYQEAAIILEGPPIEIFAQRAAPTGSNETSATEAWKVLL